MDFRRYALLSVACIAVLHTARAGCKEDTEKTDEYKECMRSYQTYLAGAGQTGGDQTQMMTLFCSQEGQSAGACMQPLIEKCPALTTNPMLSMFDVIKSMGGCQSMGGGMGGGTDGGMGGGMGGGSAECNAASQECASMQGGAEEPDMSPKPTEFHKFQEEIKTICGMVKAQFDCLKKYETKCPKLEEQFKQMMEIGRQNSPPGTPFPEFEDQKNFVMKECPKFPKDFSTSTCVKDNLNKKEFTDCYNNATTKKTGEQMTCDEYKAAFPCVTTALQSCGATYMSSFTATTNFYLAATFNDCNVAMKKETSSANVYTTSVSTLLFSFFLIVSTLIVF